MRLWTQRSQKNGGEGMKIEGLREKPPTEYPVNCAILSLVNWGVESLHELNDLKKTLTDIDV